MPDYIFISYSKKNRTYAQALANDLLARRFDVWIDDRLEYGQSWEREIFEAIDGCAAFIVLMTPEAYSSDWVLRECQYADKRRKAQFPLLLNGEEFPRYGPTQYVDVRDGQLPGSDFYARLARVVPRDQIGENVTPVSNTIPLSSSPRSAPVAFDPVAPVAPARIRSSNPTRRNLTIALIAGIFIAVGGGAVAAMMTPFLLSSAPARTATPTSVPNTLMPTETSPLALAETLIPTEVNTTSDSETPAPVPACPGSPPARLVSDGSARVVEGGQPNRLRETPSPSGTIITSIPPGTTITITGMAQCDGEVFLRWWPVRYNGREGWTAEGIGDEYYLEPRVGESTPEATATLAS